nr:MAG TPA: hypothetical protein [Caudoviricetes sp.]
MTCNFLDQYEGLKLFAFAACRIVEKNNCNFCFLHLRNGCYMSAVVSRTGRLKKAFMTNDMNLCLDYFDRLLSR